MAKKSSKPRHVQNLLTLRFTKDELDDLGELERQQHAAGVPNTPAFAKQLLKKQLYAEPSSERVPGEFHDATAKLHEAVQKLDARTKKMRSGFANGIGHLLQACAGWSEDEVKEWHQKHMRD
jgi:hypothetical protein